MRMRRNHLIVPALVFMGFAVPLRAEVHWNSTVAAATEQAVGASKPILIEFWADWCVPCKVMDREVFSTAEFERAAGKFVPVKVNADKNKALSRKHNVLTLPAIVIADSYGNQLFRHEGYLSLPSTLALLKALPGNVAEFNRLNQVLAREKDNFQALAEIGTKLKEAGLFRASVEYYSRALQNQEARSNPLKRESILNEIGLNLLQVRDARAAAATFERCLKEFPNSLQKDEWTLNLAQAYAFGTRNDQEKAKNLLMPLALNESLGPQSEKAKLILEGIR
jgi:thiol-disulfide isomerase/thioredoxin